MQSNQAAASGAAEAAAQEIADKDKSGSACASMPCRSVLLRSAWVSGVNCMVTHEPQLWISIC